MYIPTD
ncbi:hypothetical protein CCHL11_10068 [Colletotrichum chlorophyti]|nr:hypothetical protein CCHL11_10068 [Colletotrichum chlorophyti]